MIFRELKECGILLRPSGVFDLLTILGEDLVLFLKRSDNFVS